MTLRTLTRRATVGFALAGAALLAVAGPAGAAPSAVSGTPSAAEAQAAHQAADTPQVHRLLAGFFADRGQPAKPANAAHRDAVAATMNPTLATTVPVYYLSPGFVKGDSATVADLAYMATDAVSSDGQHATVWTVRDKAGTGWVEMNIASGDNELRYARQAGNGVVFREPQVNAWYTISSGRVVPLNESARMSVGTDGASMGEYQKLVHDRYADKMAGSAYVKKHTIGGNWLPKPAAKPVAAPQHSGSTTLLPMLLAGFAVFAGAAVVLWRRVSRRSTASA